MKRICESCHKVEDEVHFLIDCDRYKYERIDMFKKITREFPNFEEIKDSNSKFIFLMSQENKKITILLASCVFNFHIKFVRIDKGDLMTFYVINRYILYC